MASCTEFIHFVPTFALQFENVKWNFFYHVKSQCLPDTGGRLWTKFGGEKIRMEVLPGCAIPTWLKGTQE